MLKSMCGSLPRGKHRTALTHAGRIQTLQFKRSMTASEVEARIRQGFKEINGLHSWKVLDTVCNVLLEAKIQSLDGEAVINRKGSLYLCQEAHDISSVGSGKGKGIGDGSKGKGKAPIVADGRNSGHSSSSGEDPDLPRVNVKRPCVAGSEVETQPRPVTRPRLSLKRSHEQQRSLESWRELRHQQDEEYARSLAIDQEKAQKARKEQERKEVLYSLQLHFRDKFVSETGGDVKVSIKRDSSRIETTFNPEDCTQLIYEFVFAQAADFEDRPFCVCQTFPRKLIPCSRSTTIREVDISGLLTVDTAAGEFQLIDPLKLLPQVAAEELKAVACAELDCLKKAENDRYTFVRSLDFQVSGGAHVIDRDRVYQDVIELYSSKKDQILLERPFRIKFSKERAFDIGGVAKDMFSAFYEEVYVRLFDGPSLVTPIDFPNFSSSPLPVLGTVISHCYLTTGILPVKIAFPCLCAMLLNSTKLPEAVLVQSFVDSLNCFEASLVERALSLVDTCDSFPEDVQSKLIDLYSRFRVRELPKVGNFYQILVEISKYHFFRKPAAAIAEVHSGIPDIHSQFWEKISVGDFYQLYRALQVSPAKVLALLDSVIVSNENQERVLGYLRQFVGNMKTDELRRFLRYFTGAAVCSSTALSVTFNTVDGFTRRPTGHTCGSALELSTTYTSYQDLVAEFECILSDRNAWKMDAV